MNANRPPRSELYLKLGRVSNLPTVWTNTLAGIALGGGVRDVWVALRLQVAFSLFYVGGMFLNDAFDREVDARERPERPIPSGQIAASEVFAVGFGLMGAGLILLIANARGMGGDPIVAIASGSILATLIVLYDAWHKQNQWSPVVMGACRAAVYVSAGLVAGGTANAALLVGAFVAGAYIVGLTFVARQENRHSFRAGGTLALLSSPVAVAAFGPTMGVVAFVALAVLVGWVSSSILPLFGHGKVNVPRAVVRLIAGVSLVDALLMAAYAAPYLAVFGLLGFGATLFLQRWVRGT